MLHITTKGRETNLFAEKKKTTLARLAEKKQVHGEEKKKQVHGREEEAVRKKCFFGKKFVLFIILC